MDIRRLNFGALAQTYFFACLLALGVAMPASATTVTFNFQGLGNATYGSTHIFTDAATGVELMASAQSGLGLPGGGVAPAPGTVLVNNNYGLSVSGSGSTNGGLNSQDGEGILFSFLPSGWKLESVTLSLIDGTGVNTDRAQIYDLDGAGNSVGGEQLFGLTGTGSSRLATYTIAGVVTDPVGIAAIARASGLASNFRIASITISQVPLPAAAWLMLTAIGGLFGMKRLKMASTA